MVNYNSIKGKILGSREICEQCEEEKDDVKFRIVTSAEGTKQRVKYCWDCFKEEQYESSGFNDRKEGNHLFPTYNQHNPMTVKRHKRHFNYWLKRELGESPDKKW